MAVITHLNSYSLTRVHGQFLYIKILQYFDFWNSGETVGIFIKRSQFMEESLIMQILFEWKYIAELLQGLDC